ncbi:hypothetical protein TNCV_574251 [Trichonephila clavipes]|nr:hypothetical protein TNCV_574251 [Trichonephila clavipes]
MANNQICYTTSGCLPEVESLGEVGGRPQCDKCGCRVRIAHSIVSRLWRQFQTTGTAIRESVVVVHEEPHPQMTGTLSYRPEETGGRQREKSLTHDTGDWTTDIAFYRGQKTARWWSVCTTPCTVVPLTPAHRRKSVLCGAGNTEIGETMNEDEYSLQMRADF